MANSLKKYREKRDFKKTGEPHGDAKKKSKKRFSIQKHDASNLHYDFRLEYEGVLKSWAIPKGPSTDPADKRLAIQTEDHPVDYIDFEGTIPEGEYGAGKVMVWDRGTYENITEKDGELRGIGESLDAGHLLINLNGEKLKGGYAFNRMEGEKWLMVKMDDAESDARRNPVSTEPESVKSGKKIKDIE
ncbi:MAG: DNA ligase [Flavobacteriales bacterium]|nr:DNA ligase [Flavobacteriales bacterium]